MGNNISNTSDCDKFGEDDYYLDDDVFAAAFSRHFVPKLLAKRLLVKRMTKMQNFVVAIHFFKFVVLTTMTNITQNLTASGFSCH